MKARLLFEDRDYFFGYAYHWRTGYTVTGPKLPFWTAALAQDLELSSVLDAMGGGDSLVRGVAWFVVLSSLPEPRQIAYRQEVLADFLANPDIAREMYSIALEALVRERAVYKSSRMEPPSVLRRAVEVLEIFSALLQRLRKLADDNVGRARSPGLGRLFAVLQSELDDAYFEAVGSHLRRLRFKGGSLLSAKLGQGNRGTGYVLRTPKAVKRGWKQRVGLGPRTSLSFELSPRDEAGFRALSELNGRGLNLVANALAQSTDHILSFFRMLCAETAFYVGCINLHEALAAKGEPVCMPVPLPPGSRSLSYKGIYDISLALRSGARLVGNDADADGKSLVMVTGANSGGKSTLLRSLGLAQLMMQCGMFVGAEAFRAEVAQSVFTHFIREEDAGMESGKLDEELVRMSAIADNVGAGSLVLFNESFAATNEREGSEIAGQIIRALTEAGVKVYFVTHQFTLADTFYRRDMPPALFLRAERAEDGQRTFKVAEGPPLATSFGEDLYRRIGGWDGGGRSVA